MDILLLPFIGSLFQYIVIDVALSWPMYTLAVLLNYLILEKSEMEKDDLTNLPSRAELRRRAEHKLGANESFTMIMIDLNDFKDINDTFGHQQGDKVLKVVSEILVSATDPVDTVSRYGGDEFMLLIESDNDKIKTELIARIEQNLDIRNARLNRYRISLSYGALFVPADSNLSYEKIVKDIDEKMYLDKKRRKQVPK